MRFDMDEWGGFETETVPQFTERRAVDLYDSECLRLLVAVRAIWILYRRGKWGLLASVGLPRDRYEAKFYKFDVAHITSDTGLLRLDTQAEAFCDAVPGVRVAASNLIERYEALFPDQVHSYYNKILRKLGALEVERTEE